MANSVRHLAADGKMRGARAEMRISLTLSSQRESKFACRPARPCEQPATGYQGAAVLNLPGDLARDSLHELTLSAIRARSMHAAWSTCGYGCLRTTTMILMAVPLTGRRTRTLRDGVRTD